MKKLALLALLLASAAAVAGDSFNPDINYLDREISVSGRVLSISNGTDVNASGERSDLRYVALRSRQGDDVLTVSLVYDAKNFDESKFYEGASIRASGICNCQRIDRLNPQAAGSGMRVQLFMRNPDAELLKSFSGARFVYGERVSGPLAENMSSTGGDAGGGKQPNSADRKLRAESEENFEISFDERYAMKSIATAQGAKGNASAFVVKINGKSYLATNIHVIFDNDVKFTTVTNERIEVGEPLFSNDRDLALFELKSPEKIPALEMEEDVSKLPPERPVIVFGNSLGAGVNTRLKGRIKGIGPQTVEISAQIVPGNSGSPILDATNGKVVGVSTYGSIRKADFTTKGTRFEEARRFGTRLDTANVAAFEQFDRRKYADDVKLRETVEDSNALALALLSDICEQRKGRFYPTLESSRYDYVKHPSLKQVVSDWNDVITGKVAVANRSTLNVPSVLKRLKSQVTTPLMNVRKRPANYAWVKENVEKQLELNDSYCKSFDDLKKDIEDSTK